MGTHSPLPQFSLRSHFCQSTSLLHSPFGISIHLPPLHPLSHVAFVLLEHLPTSAHLVIKQTTCKALDLVAGGTRWAVFTIASPGFFCNARRNHLTYNLQCRHASGRYIRDQPSRAVV